MAWKSAVLVIANVTATSHELVDALKARAQREPVSFTLIIPATHTAGGHAAAAQELAAAVERMRDAGVEVEGSVADADPFVAVAEAWDPKRYDEIILSTLPTGVSRWLQADLPRRVAKLTGALVTHVVSQPPKHEPETVHVVENEKYGLLTPLAALGGQARRRSTTPVKPSSSSNRAPRPS